MRTYCVCVYPHFTLLYIYIYIAILFLLCVNGTTFFPLFASHYFSVDENSDWGFSAAAVQLSIGNMHQLEVLCLYLHLKQNLVSHYLQTPTGCSF